MDRRVDLLAEDFHLDVRTGNAGEPNLIGHRIVRSARVLCAAPDYLARWGEPQSLADLAQHRCLLFRDRNEPFGTWCLRGPRGNEEVRVSGDLASNDNDVVLGWAHDGHGILIGADWFLARSLAQGRLQRVLPAWEQPVDVWALSAQRTQESAKVRLFIEALRAEMQALG
jgi:LysR family transcriptional activator of dmlA